MGAPFFSTVYVSIVCYSPWDSPREHRLSPVWPCSLMCVRTESSMDAPFFTYLCSYCVLGQSFFVFRRFSLIYVPIVCQNLGIVQGSTACHLSGHVP